GRTATSTTSGGSVIVGIPGTNPSASPPRTRKIGYGTCSFGAAISSAANTASSASRMSWSWVPKCTGRAYVVPRLLRYVRDLRSRVRERLRRSGAPRADELDARPPRARQRWGGLRRHRGTRRAPPLDHRPRDGRPADRERGRDAARRPERRALQLPRAAPRARAGGSHLPNAGRYGGAAAPLRAARRRLRRAAAGDVRRRDLGR